MLAILPWRVVGENNLLKYMFFQGCWKARAARLGLAICVWPPTVDSHNFFVETPF